MATWRIQGFREVRPLGEGAQGEVVLALHEESGSPVAIKYLAPGADEEDRGRLRHEAQMLARADSPHIARLYRLVEGPDGAALVMEAVNGASLKAILERHGALGPEASLTVLKGSLLGLAAAHGLGVVHRDYKPANVVVPPDGTSKLIDFGIATPAGAETGGAGTPRYMAPEQWGRHAATPATDVYAATCVFVECVSGHPPFEGKNRAALRQAHLTEAPPVDAVPEPLRPLVAQGMAKEPDDRPDSAAVFVEELEGIAREAYGRDWEARGVRALAASAVALAALFPLAALTLVPAGAGAAGAAATAGAAGSAGAGAGAGAGGGTGLMAGGTAAKIAAGAAATALAVGGTVAVQRLVPEEAEPRAVPTVRRAAFVQVRQCRVTGPSGDDRTPTGSPAPVRLPGQVRLPPGAAVFRFGADTYLIGEAGDDCSESSGNGGGGSEVGSPATGYVRQTFQYTVGGISGQICRFFPGSPEAVPFRQSGRCDISDPVPARRNLNTEIPGVRGVIAAVPEDVPDTPPSPYVAVTLAIMGKDGVPATVTCTMPWSKAPICTAALTYWFARSTRKLDGAEAALDRVAARIEAAVGAARR